MLDILGLIFMLTVVPTLGIILLIFIVALFIGGSK